MNIKRGQIYLIDFEPVKDSEQGKVRPALIIQNDIGNKYSKITIVIPITSQVSSKRYPINVIIEPEDGGLTKMLEILCNQVRAVSKSRIKGFIGKISMQKMEEVERAILISFGMVNYRKLN